jgi:hypothetical protein
MTKDPDLKNGKHSPTLICSYLHQEFYFDSLAVLRYAKDVHIHTHELSNGDNFMVYHTSQVLQC